MTQSKNSESPLTLHPALESALGGLDVKLEDELSRYRRLRREHEAQAKEASKRQKVLRAKKLINLLTENSTIAQSPLPSPETVSPETSPAEVPQLDHPLQPDLLAPETSTSQPQLPLVGNDAITPDLSSEEIASLVHQPVDPETSPELEAPEKQPTPPEDYLESSEQLLRNLGAEKKVQAPSNSRWTNFLLTPVGMASLFILLVFSALVGVATINLEILSYLGLDRWFNSPIADTGDKLPDPQSPETVASGGTNLNSSSSDTSESLPEFKIPQEPDLVTTELEKVTFGTLPTLDPNASESLNSNDDSEATSPEADLQTTPSSSPRSTVSQPRIPGTESNDLARRLLGPLMQPRPLQPFVPVTPPSTAANNPEIASAPQQDGYYYVLVDYTSDRALSSAQTVVPDAYLREFPGGVKVQMGAFNREFDAQRLVAELQGRGISASIYFSESD